ncbi:MAG: hypothetical protein U9N34_09380, partial [Candidatus Cloacimonadota bacterium]|nr:hypothetical protein [Candidatus Cloacimonadota bacterium]
MKHIQLLLRLLTFLLIFSTLSFSASDSCDGDIITGNVSGEVVYHGWYNQNKHDYYQFKAPSNGELDISFSATRILYFHVGTSCDAKDILRRDKETSGSKSDIVLAKDEVVY